MRKPSSPSALHRTVARLTRTVAGLMGILFIASTNLPYAAGANNPGGAPPVTHTPAVVTSNLGSAYTVGRHGTAVVGKTSVPGASSLTNNLTNGLDLGSTANNVTLGANL